MSRYLKASMVSILVNEHQGSSIRDQESWIKPIKEKFFYCKRIFFIGDLSDELESVKLRLTLVWPLHDFQDWSNEPKRDWPFDFWEERTRHRRIERGLDVEDANSAHVGHNQQWQRGSHIQSKPRVGQITSLRNKVTYPDVFNWSPEQSKNCEVRFKDSKCFMQQNNGEGIWSGFRCLTIQRLHTKKVLSRRRQSCWLTRRRIKSDKTLIWTKKVGKKEASYLYFHAIFSSKIPVRLEESIRKLI